jgi:pimeloyl-ACP methyl ester carboxylesterase
MPELIRESAHIYYETEGPDDGYPLIFVHGMGLSHVSWRPQVDAVTAAGYRSITFDIRGHGRSSPDGAAQEETRNEREHTRTHVKRIICDITRDLYMIMDRLALGKAILIAYSTGCVIAQQFAIDYPHRTDGLLLSGAFPKASNAYMIGRLAGGIGLAALNLRRLLETGVARSNGKDREQIRIFKDEAQKVSRTATIRILQDTLAFDCRDDLKQLPMPVLVTYGGNERHMMKYRTEYLQLLSGSEVCLFPNVNHAASMKKEDDYNRVLLDFAGRTAHGDNPYFFKPINMNPTPRPTNGLKFQDLPESQD